MQLLYIMVDAVASAAGYIVEGQGTADSCTWRT